MIFVFAGGGNDTVYLGDGHDAVYGSGGHDKIFSGAGNDNSFGGSGDDLIRDVKGFNNLSGGIGADKIQFATTSRSIFGEILAGLVIIR